MGGKITAASKRSSENLLGEASGSRIRSRERSCTSGSTQISSCPRHKHCMSYRNLHLHHITYAKATDLFARTKKTCRGIANNTMIERSTDPRDPENNVYRVWLHDTDIMTLFADGAVRVRLNGWGSQPTTRDRLRNYLPSHMQVIWGNRSQPSSPDIMRIYLDDDCVHRPVGDGAIFLPNGTVEGNTVMNQYDAIEVWDQVRTYAKKYAQAFMYGKISQHESPIRLYTAESAMALLRSGELIPPPFYPMREDTRFYKENYELSSPKTPKKRTKEEVAKWLEDRMQGAQMRPAPGTYHHVATRRRIKEAIMLFFKIKLFR